MEVWKVFGILNAEASLGAFKSLMLFRLLNLSRYFSDSIINPWLFCAIFGFSINMYRSHIFLYFFKNDLFSGLSYSTTQEYRIRVQVFENSSVIFHYLSAWTKSNFHNKHTFRRTAPLRKSKSYMSVTVGGKPNRLKPSFGGTSRFGGYVEHRINNLNRWLNNYWLCILGLEASTRKQQQILLVYHMRK